MGKEFSVEQQVAGLWTAFADKFASGTSPDEEPMSMVGCYKNYVVVAKGNGFYKVPFKGDMSSPTFAERDGWVAVEPGWDKKKATSFKAFDDGTWVGIFTNAFEDREGEFFATPALKEFVSWTKAENITMPLWFWHMPYDMGMAEAFEMAGRMVVVAGHLNETGKAIAKWYSEHPEETLGMSHQFEWSPLRKDGKTYLWFRPSEVTFLPWEKAANAYTVYIVGGNMDEKSKKLVEILGEEKATEVLTEAEAKSKALEENVAFKEVEAQPAPKAEEAPKEETKEVVIAEPAIARAVVDPETIQALATAIVSQLGPVFEKFASVIQPIAQAVDEQGKQLKELVKTDDEKVKERLAALPPLDIFRATIQAPAPTEKKEVVAPGKSIHDMTLGESIQNILDARSKVQ